MVRAKTNVARHRRVKRVMKRAEGFFQGRRKLYRQALETVERAEQYAWRDRRAKKRDFRRLWIVRISAACKERAFAYSRLIQGLKKANVVIDRKMLADLAVADAAAFDRLVETAKGALA
ncbi:MAG TPA: 50S ribosomal protein L20 [Planctomycetota bacterium]|nr:50S ribosomal protein L20 [Planctomycetota bacterium]